MLRSDGVDPGNEPDKLMFRWNRGANMRYTKGINQIFDKEIIKNHTKWVYDHGIWGVEKYFNSIGRYPNAGR